MMKLAKLLIVTILLLFILTPYHIYAQTDELLQNRIIVKFQEHTPDTYKQRILEKYTQSKQQQLERLHAHILTVDERVRDRYIAAISRIPGVEYVEPDYIATATYTPNDPRLSDQWGIAKTQADLAWDTIFGSPTVDVAILDTGIEEHEDLLGAVELSKNFTTDPLDDKNGHGTHVAGIIAAAIDNNTGVVGVAPGVDLINAKVLKNNGSGYYSWIADAIRWATDNGAEIINMSLSGRYSSYTLQQAVDYAWDHGVIVVAAAGNEGRRRVLYPAYYENVIAVAATDEHDNKASFSNYGTDVDVAAPGVSILSTRLGDYSYMSGTSMATPFVSGILALIKSKYTSYDNAATRNKLQSSADTISRTGSYWKHGRVNACSAVDCDDPNNNDDPPPPPPEEELTPTPTNTPTPTPTPTEEVQEPSATPTPTPTPTPLTNPKPWWCKYVPSHRYCQ